MIGKVINGRNKCGLKKLKTSLDTVTKKIMRQELG